MEREEAEKKKKEAARLEKEEAARLAKEEEEKKKEEAAELAKKKQEGEDKGGVQMPVLELVRDEDLVEKAKADVDDSGEDTEDAQENVSKKSMVVRFDSDDEKRTLEEGVPHDSDDEIAVINDPTIPTLTGMLSFRCREECSSTSFCFLETFS